MDFHELHNPVAGKSYDGWICPACRRQMRVGDQIAYIPNHAGGDIQHPDTDFGFVTGTRGDIVFCRYWRHGQPGTLRTVANSEATSARDLVKHDSVDQGIVDRLIEELNHDTE